MYGYIYETTCILTGKKYLGMHKYDKEISWNTNPDPSYIGSGTVLQKAINKYGKENFVCKVLCYCKTREQLSNLEAQLISYYKAPVNEDYYNVNDGGFGGHTEYYKQETTEKQLEALAYGRLLPTHCSNNSKEALSNWSKQYTASGKNAEHMLGKISITNGLDNKYINPEDTIPEGWYKGQTTTMTDKWKNSYIARNDNQEWKNNISKTVSNQRWVCKDGEKAIKIHKDDLDKYLELGYHQGRK